MTTSSHHLGIFPLLLLLIFTRLNKAQQPIVSFEVQEESPLHTTIGNITNFLLPEPTITTDSSFFNVTRSGLVRLAHRLDLEALCTDKFLCCESEKPCELTSSVVIESRTSGDMQTLELRVHVLDINDHSPAFPSASQTLQVSELAKVGSVLSLTAAVDRDVVKANQVKRYALHGLELQRTFELDHVDSSTLRLRLIRPLDYEKVTEYRGALEACDPRHCARQNLTILVSDANDNRPAFLKTSYTVTIPENYTVGQTVLQLEAEDKDSPPNAQMNFQFHGKVDQGLKNTFRLESDTGRIVLRTHLAAHRRSEYQFVVSVTESRQTGQVDPGASGGTGLPTEADNSTANVVIFIEDLNDFSPTIKMFSPSEGQALSVPENAPPTRVCVVQVTDLDSGENGRVTCTLVPYAASPSEVVRDAFQLSNTGKLYTLSTTRPFDTEREPQVTVTIACTDYGEPQRSSSRDLVVKVEDVNEFRPELEKTSYHAAVHENAQAGVEVVRVVATDHDHSAQLHYELSAEGKQYFTVDPLTGSVTTLGETVDNLDNLSGGTSTLLDREKTEQITFIVCVSDGPPTSVCGNVGNMDATPRSRSAASSSSSKLIYTVSATVFVTVLDQNDNRPQFIEKGPFSVSENQPQFTRVGGRVTAIDNDKGENGLVRYSLRQAWKSANGMPAPDLFQVDANGRIQTMEVLDRESTNAYTLELVACDSASQTPLCTSLNATVTVLDENDNTPVWRYPHEQDKEVNITADLPVGHIIARVHATDRDAGENGRVVYSLIDPHRRTVFQVDNHTGDVAVGRDRTDASRKEEHQKDSPDSIKPSPLLPGIYRLRLRATDQGHPQQKAETWLQVNVFGADSTTSAGLNFMIIVVMVAVTGLISICLVVAIICVRRRSVALRANHDPRGPRANGFRRDRAAGDGAEGVHFPLKHEFPYPPMDGSGGYLMGVSPTPSDLDAMKYAYQPVPAVLPYVGAMNGGRDSAHLISWSSGNPGQTATVCYPAGAEPMELVGDQAMDGTLRLPVYAPYHHLSTGDGMGTMKLMRPPMSAGSQMHVGGSSSCLSFTSPSPNPDQQGSTGTGGGGGLQSFQDAYILTQCNSNGSVTAAGMHDGSYAMDACGDPHRSSVAALQRRAYNAYEIGCLAPSATGVTSNAGAVYCPGSTSHRRGVASHGELDVDSADSGRGPSEDDPVASTTTAQLLHFYPTLQMAHYPHTLVTSDGHLVNGDCSSIGRTVGADADGTSTIVNGCNGGPIQLNLRNTTSNSDDTCEGVPQDSTTTEPWNSSDRRFRRPLKC